MSETAAEFVRSLPVFIKRLSEVAKQSDSQLVWFSLQDNELLDHEGPPAGTPSQSERCLIHYRAPTEPGSSGSPVFNEAPDWQVIGLHHAGGEYVRKLNGQSGTYAANEAIWIQSIAKAMAESFTV